MAKKLNVVVEELGACDYAHSFRVTGRVEGATVVYSDVKSEGLASAVLSALMAVAGAHRYSDGTFCQKYLSVNKAARAVCGHLLRPESN